MLLVNAANGRFNSAPPKFWMNFTYGFVEGLQVRCIMPLGIQFVIHDKCPEMMLR